MAWSGAPGVSSVAFGGAPHSNRTDSISREMNLYKRPAFFKSRVINKISHIM